MVDHVFKSHHRLVYQFVVVCLRELEIRKDIKKHDIYILRT